MSIQLKANLVDYTIAILSYNSSKYIIEGLESIRFQVEKFGNGCSVQLIVSDDSSQDDTIRLVKNWSTHYEALFNEITILESENNEGTVANFHKMFHSIHGKYFITIGGDDILSSENVFKFMDLLDEYDLVTSFPICLNDKGDIFKDKNRLLRNYRDFIAAKYSKDTYVKKEIYGSLLHTVSTVYRKELYDRNIEAFVKQFRLFEDDPRWFRILQASNNIMFYPRPIIIYRIRNNSVSHSISTKKQFLEDYLRLDNVYHEYLNDDLLKFYIRSRDKALKSNKKYSFANFVRLLDAVFLHIKYYGNQGYKEFNSNINTCIAHTKPYCKQIKDNSLSFYKSVEDCIFLEDNR